MQKFQEPTISRGTKSDWDEENHPAYAQIGASRVTGRAYLYGSDFDHQHYVTITIRKSTLNRSLSRDWTFGREELIEVALSEAQWAEFVSTPNSGQGTQCTLQQVAGEDIPQIPRPKDRQEQFKNEGRAALEDAVKSLADLQQALREAKLTNKAKKELLWMVERAVRAITLDERNGIGFIAKSFGEHVERITEHAKVEVHAYIQNAINRAGLKSLGAEPPIRLLEGEVIDDTPTP